MNNTTRRYPRTMSEAFPRSVEYANPITRHAGEAVTPFMGFVYTVAGSLSVGAAVLLTLAFALGTA